MLMPLIHEDDPLFVQISEAGKEIGHMEETFGPDSIQHQEAVRRRNVLIDDWRRSRKEADGDTAAT